MSDPRSDDDAHRQRRREMLSSMADGHCPADEADDALRAWRSDEQSRRDWRTYHLIGDVLRSDDLSVGAHRDPVFLRGLRERLAAEPVPLAPAPLRAAPGARSRRWLSSAAAVAGFAVVGASVVLLRPAGEPAPGWQAAQTVVVEPSGAGQRVGAAAMPAASQVLVIDGQVIRDARLDAYFEAHRGALGPMPTAMPGGALRSVEILVPQR